MSFEIIPALSFWGPLYNVLYPYPGSEVPVEVDYDETQTLTIAAMSNTTVIRVVNVPSGTPMLMLPSNDDLLTLFKNPVEGSIAKYTFEIDGANLDLVSTDSTIRITGDVSTVSIYISVADPVVINLSASYGATGPTGSAGAGTNLGGDVTGPYSANTVVLVSNLGAPYVATGAALALNSTGYNIANSIVRRDTSGNFAASTVSATGVLASVFTGGTYYGNTLSGFGTVIISGVAADNKHLDISGTVNKSGYMYSASIMGTLNSVSGTDNNQYALLLQPTYNTAAGTTDSIFGVFIPALDGTSNPARAYGASFKRPNIGSAKMALNTDDLSVGYTLITPPVGGAIIQNTLGLGTDLPNNAYILDAVGNIRSTNVTASAFTGTTFTGASFYGQSFTGASVYAGTLTTASISSSAFVGGTFTGSSYAGGSYTGASVSAQSYTGGSYVGGTYTGIYFAGQTFTGGSFAGQTFTGGTIHANTMVTQNFAASAFVGGTFTGSSYAGGSYTGASVSAQSYTGDSYVGGTYTGISFSGQTFTGGAFAGGSYTGVSVAAQSYTGGSYVGGTYTGISFSGQTFTGGAFAGGSYTGASVSAQSYTGGSYVGGTYTGISVTSDTLVVGPGAADSSALVTVSSTTKGVLLPRMTTVQKNAIASPTDGLLIYDTTMPSVSIRNSSIWRAIDYQRSTCIIAGSSSGATAVAFAGTGSIGTSRAWTGAGGNAWGASSYYGVSTFSNLADYNDHKVKCTSDWLVASNGAQIVTRYTGSTSKTFRVWFNIKGLYNQFTGNVDYVRFMITSSVTGAVVQIIGDSWSSVNGTISGSGKATLTNETADVLTVVMNVYNPPAGYLSYLEIGADEIFPYEET